MENNENDIPTFLRVEYKGDNKISPILDIINHVDLDEEDMIALKARMKEIDKKIKDKNKPKTITISGKDHAIIKNHCSVLNLNIGEWASKVLLKEIEEDVCFESVSKEDLVDDIKKKYSSVKKTGLYKTNKLVINKNFIFAGYSVIDLSPIYRCEYLKRDVIDHMSNLGIECKLVIRDEVSQTIEHNPELKSEILEY